MAALSLMSDMWPAQELFLADAALRAKPDRRPGPDLVLIATRTAVYILSCLPRTALVADIAAASDPGTRGKAPAALHVTAHDREAPASAHARQALVAAIDADLAALCEEMSLDEAGNQVLRAGRFL